MSRIFCALLLSSSPAWAMPEVLWSWGLSGPGGHYGIEVREEVWIDVHAGPWGMFRVTNKQVLTAGCILTVMLIGLVLMVRHLKRLSRKAIEVKTASLLVGIGLVSSSCSPPPHPATFEGWEIKIDQPISQLEEELRDLDQQQPMNYTIANISFLYDAKLYILFHDFIEKLPEPTRTAEINEQREWLKQRHAQVEKAYARYEGGTLAPYNAAETDISFTKQRIALIEEKIKTLSESTKR